MEGENRGGTLDRRSAAWLLSRWFGVDVLRLLAGELTDGHSFLSTVTISPSPNYLNMPKLNTIYKNLQFTIDLTTGPMTDHT